MDVKWSKTNHAANLDEIDTNRALNLTAPPLKSIGRSGRGTRRGLSVTLTLLWSKEESFLSFVKATELAKKSTFSFHVWALTNCKQRLASSPVPRPIRTQYFRHMTESCCIIGHRRIHRIHQKWRCPMITQYSVTWQVNAASLGNAESTESITNPPELAMNPPK